MGKEETITLSFEDAVQESVSYGDFHVNSYGRLPDGGDFIDLEAGAGTQLYASPGRKNFMTPESLYSATSLNFTAFDAQEAALEAEGMRVFGLDASLSEDVEPEYITVSPDGSKAWVSLQENNALAVVDLNTSSISDIYPLGFKDYGAAGNEVDPSDKDEASTLSTWANVFGMYQPDGVASFNEGGTNYVITANEGDARDWLAGLEEGPRVEDLTLSAGTFPDFATLQGETQLGRLTVTAQLHDSTPTTVHEKLYSFGARSFSIWNGDTGALVFDSGSDLATQAIAAGIYPDDRSDAKGTEPENIAVGMVGSKRLAFIALERADAVAVYDITDLGAISFSQMLINSGDDAPEGVVFVSAADSPSGKALVIVSNEGSGNISIYESDTNGNFSFASSLVIEGGEGAAEISAFDPATDRLFVVNNGVSLSSPRIEVLDLSNPSAAQLLSSIDVSYYGAGVNSVAVSGGKLAAAIEAADRSQAGSVVVFDSSSYELLGIAHVGALPDMLTFTPDGTKILTADEGEPLEDYSVDPLGTISIVSLN